MKVLLCCLDSEAIETCCMGASGLWVLLHNNQRVHAHPHTCARIQAYKLLIVQISYPCFCFFPKARTRLKCPTVRLRIQEAHARFKKGIHQFTLMSNVDVFHSCDFFCPVNNRTGEQTGTHIGLLAEVPGKSLPAAKTLIVFIFLCLHFL